MCEKDPFKRLQINPSVSSPWLLSITLWHLRIPASYNIQFHDLTARSEVFRLFTTYTSTYMIIRYYKERFFTFSKYLMNSLILSVCDIFMLFLLFTALSFTSFLFGKVSITICNTVVVKKFPSFHRGCRNLEFFMISLNCSFSKVEWFWSVLLQRL